MPPTKRDAAIAAAKLAIEMAGDDVKKATVNGWIVAELLAEIAEMELVREAVRTFLDTPRNGSRYDSALDDLITSLDSYERRVDERNAAA